MRKLMWSFLLVYGVPAAYSASAVDCYRADELKFSNDSYDQRNFRQTLRKGEIHDKKTDPGKEVNYASKTYKLTPTDTGSYQLDTISTADATLATYTRRMSAMINSLRSYSIVSGRKLCFSVGSYKKPLIDADTVNSILSIEGGTPKSGLKIPTSRLSVQNTNWEHYEAIPGSDTTHRVYSYRGLVFDNSFVIAFLSQAAGEYVLNHLKKNRWWVVQWPVPTIFTDNLDSCRFSDLDCAYLSTVIPTASFSCGRTEIPTTDRRHHLLVTAKEQATKSGEYLVTFNTKGELILQLNGKDKVVFKEAESSSWFSFGRKKCTAVNLTGSASTSTFSGLPPAYTPPEDEEV